jgi:mannose/cellobiose epimerase-like protein (N-acyl-D-glucosamine 2-epimerase family)
VTKRLWPQTERVKALAARGSRRATQARRGSRPVALLLCAPRRSQDARFEQLSRDGRVISDAQNATSVYHVVMALSEAIEAVDG